VECGRDGNGDRKENPHERPVIVLWRGQSRGDVQGDGVMVAVGYALNGENKSVRHWQEQHLAVMAGMVLLPVMTVNLARQCMKMSQGMEQDKEAEQDGAGHSGVTGISQNRKSAPHHGGYRFGNSMGLFFSHDLLRSKIVRRRSCVHKYVIV